MAEATLGFTITNPHIRNSIHPPKHDLNPFSKSLRQCSTSGFFTGSHQLQESKKKRASLCKVNALPDWPLMAVLVENFNGIDFITTKTVTHLSDRAIKNVYVFYIFYTCWGCLFFGSMKDPYYDSEYYRGDGGDGTGHWIYDKQADIEESARRELWREELIEEIEQKVGSLPELEEAGRK
ncbi:hypothetical protein Tsubulata_009380 [Turnera subulata]|uniref:Uncharacterized protein n=1 Tax=Turnera subulata TaxID=218843 RepID=A0A9Q0G2M3_9ROSI|nr:hypothetical protein Tsubulata_009380 [Turnera subulata]